ncbi:DNA polymerase IV [Blastomonas sp.]|uniref:DNA polymerase IV n=1 Tax=Blastomonas sp. TaxID=1909299 RepID=UPI00391CF44A
MTNPAEPAQRKIIHIDMDAFFASVEQRDNPALRGLPVAVGGSSRRGVVAAASYEARTFGVRSAMPSVTAQRRCPDLVFVKPRFDVYQQVSRQIRAIFAQHTDLIEPLSLDEAYLDVTSNHQNIASATHVAQMIRADIARETGLTASAGVSYNKFIAKLASDQNKPDGLCVIRPEQGPAFVAALPVKRFHGVGPRTAEKMAALGIVTGADLAAKSEQWLLTHFGSWGSYLHGAARGIDHRPVRPDRIRKSIGGERTYHDDIWAESALRDALESIADIVWERVERSEAQGRTVTLKARYADFQTITRARSLGAPVADRTTFGQIGHALIDQILPLQNGIRLLGLTLSGLSHAEDDEQSDERQPELPFG